MATNKIGYNADAQITWTLTSLASSATLVAGRESAEVDNTSTLAVDYLVSGKTKTGSSTPAANTTIEIWVVAPIEDTPTWPIVNAGATEFDGADDDVTVVSRNVLFSAARLAAVLTVDATANQVYPVAPFSVAQLFGGNCPKRFSLFMTQNSGQNLSSTAGDHAFYAQAILPTVA